VTEAQPPADDDTRTERDTPAAEVDGEAGVQPETDSSDPSEARPADANSAATPTEGRRAVRWALLAAASIVLILGGLFALIWANGAGKVEASAPVQAGNAATAQVNLAQVNKVIADLGLAAAVKARVREDGRLIVRGVVADNEQLEALTIAVSRLTWRYTPLVLTQAEFVVRALALAPNLPEGIVPLAEEGGLLVLRAKREDVDWVLARQLVDSELPEAVAIDHRSFGGAQVTLTVTQAVAQPAVGKPASPAAAARSTALALSPLPSVATDSPTPVPAPLEAVPAPAPPPLPEVPAISAVIGGPRPFLLLGSGEKWQPGGKIGVLVLQSISNEAVVFEDSLGRTLRRAR
jgi:type III secretion protein D